MVAFGDDLGADQEVELEWRAHRAAAAPPPPPARPGVSLVRIALCAAGSRRRGPRRPGARRRGRRRPARRPCRSSGSGRARRDDSRSGGKPGAGAGGGWTSQALQFGQRRRWPQARHKVSGAKPRRLRNKSACSPAPSVSSSARAQARREPAARRRPVAAQVEQARPRASAAPPWRAGSSRAWAAGVGSRRRSGPSGTRSSAPASPRPAAPGSPRAWRARSRPRGRGRRRRPPA